MIKTFFVFIFYEIINTVYNIRISFLFFFFLQVNKIFNNNKKILFLSISKYKDKALLRLEFTLCIL